MDALSIPPREVVQRELVNDWLARAEEDLGLARLAFVQGSGYLRGAGFHAQQAGEMFLKALLTHHQIEFPKTHDLDELLELVEPVDSNLVSQLQRVSELTPYAVESRYPGLAPATQVEALQAIELAERVRASVLQALSGSD